MVGAQGILYKVGSLRVSSQRDVGGKIVAWPVGTGSHWAWGRTQGTPHQDGELHLCFHRRLATVLPRCECGLEDSSIWGVSPLEPTDAIYDIAVVAGGPRHHLPSSQQNASP